ncbi:hypothetical protein ACI79C_10150 [Geodermatophilus sp. SYSU D00697]
MGELALVLEVAAALVLVPAGYAWLGRRARRRGVGGSVMAPFEEIWDPAAHGTHVEVQVQAERAAPAPAPGDPPEPGRRSPSR